MAFLREQEMGSAHGCPEACSPSLLVGLGFLNFFLTFDFFSIILFILGAAPRGMRDLSSRTRD